MELDPADCRTILLDWALDLPDRPARRDRRLLDHYGSPQADHPMTAVLREGLGTAPDRRAPRAAAPRAGLTGAPQGCAAGQGTATQAPRHRAARAERRRVRGAGARFRRRPVRR